MIELNQNHVDKDLGNLSELLSAPVQRLIQMRRSQMAIIDILNKSTKCQYRSFETKYNVFKQMMTNFTQMNQKLQKVIFEKFDQDVESGVKKEKKNGNVNKKESDQITDEHQRDNNGRQNNIKKNEKSFNSSTQSHLQKQDKKNRLQKQNKEQKQKIQAKNKKEEPKRKKSNINRMYTQEQTSVNSDNESNQNELDFNNNHKKKATNPNTRNRKNMDTISQYDNMSTISSSNRISDFGMLKRTSNITLEEKVQWMDNLIEDKRLIPNMYANFCQLLVLPYSVLQKLIDYNQSAQYGMDVKEQRNDFD